ncbi:hypothetical protein D3C84_1235440 [compost metagenome]
MCGCVEHDLRLEATEHVVNPAAILDICDDGLELHVREFGAKLHLDRVDAVLAMSEQKQLGRPKRRNLPA